MRAETKHYHKMYFKKLRNKRALKLNEDRWNHEVITLSLVTENWKVFLYNREIKLSILRINFNTKALTHSN